MDINAQLIKELTHNPPPSLLWMNGDICYAVSLFWEQLQHHCTLDCCQYDSGAAVPADSGYLLSACDAQSAVYAFDVPAHWSQVAHSCQPFDCSRRGCCSAQGCQPGHYSCVQSLCFLLHAEGL